MQIYLLVTKMCNLSCDCCIRGQKSDDTLDVQAWQEVLRRNDFSNYNLLLTGGEPSLNSKLNEIINISYPKFKGISINTNGVLSDWLNYLTTRDIHIQVSLDGTPNIHNKLRNGDIYHDVERFIYKVEEKDIRYNISTTVNSVNYDNIPHLMSWLTRFNKMAYWKVSCEMPFGCSTINKVVGCREWNRLVDFLLDNATIKLKIRKLFDFKLFDRYIDKLPNNVNLKTKNCGDVKNKVYVYPDLTVYPCTCLTDFPLGNLGLTSMEKILHSQVAELFLNYNVKKESKCSSCKYLPLCNGGCIGMSYHYVGEIGRGDYRCPIIK